MLNLSKKTLLMESESLMNTLMNPMTVELTFSPDQFIQLDEVARTRQLILSETIQLAVTEWLENQQRLAHARTKMRKLGEGLGASQPPHDGARNHDAQLYKRPAE